MQKKIIVLAIAGAIAGLAAGSASAVDMPTFYGILDYGMVNTSGSSGQAGQTFTGPNTAATVPANSLTGPTYRGAQAVGGTGPSKENASTTNFRSGVESGSRLGVKGTVDVGSGWKGIYELEFGLNINSNGGNTATDATGSNSTTNQFWNRHTYIGVTGDNGTIVGGRLEGARYSFSNKYDPFAGGTVGNFGSLIGNQARADNAIAYISPTFGGGFSVLAAYSMNLTGTEHASNSGDLRLYAIAPQYNNGPISLTYDYEDGILTGASGVEVKINDLGGSYDFGVAKVMAYYDGLKLDAVGLDQKSYLIGATAPLGGFNFKISYADIKDNNTGTFAPPTGTSGDCKKTSIGVDYSLSKNANFFADFATITNDAGAACDIATSSTQYSGSNYFIATPGAFDAPALNPVHNTGTRGLDAGLRYQF